MQHFEELWKSELTDLKGKLSSAAKNISDKDECLFELDKPLFFSACVIRKLIEDTMITQKTTSKWLEVIQHKSSRDNEPIFLEEMFGSMDVRDHFDFESHSVVKISFKDLSSEIIHNDGLVWIIDENRVDAFAVYSYKNSLNRLIVVGLDQYVQMIDMVLADQLRHRWIRMDIESRKVTRYAE